MRPRPLADFLASAYTALNRNVLNGPSASSVSRIWSAVESEGRIASRKGRRWPVCELLSEVARPSSFDDPSLNRLTNDFLRVEPMLAWYRRDHGMENASDNINAGHANAVIVGPGGVERRNDILIGVSLLAPSVRYPDHSHPPEETYLVLSEGKFRQGDGEWFEPGVGGTFYNPPGIVHAMRSGDKPLFALWFLWAGQGGSE